MHVLHSDWPQLGVYPFTFSGLRKDRNPFNDVLVVASFFQAINLSIEATCYPVNARFGESCFKARFGNSPLHQFFVGRQERERSLSRTGRELPLNLNLNLEVPSTCKKITYVKVHSLRLLCESCSSLAAIERLKEVLGNPAILKTLRHVDDYSFVHAVNDTTTPHLVDFTMVVFGAYSRGLVLTVEFLSVNILLPESSYLRWVFSPRSTKGRLPFSSDNTNLVKRAIVKSCFAAALQIVHPQDDLQLH